MNPKKNILAIIGSASQNSSNRKLVERFIELTNETLDITIYDELRELPHFNPELSVEKTPQIVLDFQTKIAQANAVLICTPEYIFSIPSGLKNAIEWCVATTVFSDKPVGIITASAHGAKGHEELIMIMKTVCAAVTQEATLLIQGVRGKISAEGNITDEATAESLARFAEAFRRLVNEHA